MHVSVLHNNQTINHRFALAFVIFVNRLGTINGQLTMNITIRKGGTYAGICGKEGGGGGGQTSPSAILTAP